MRRGENEAVRIALEWRSQGKIPRRRLGKYGLTWWKKI